MEDKYTCLEAGYIAWPGYDMAIVSSFVKHVGIASDGNTIVMSKDGKLFNTHPLQREAGWTPEAYTSISQGCYPIRMELQPYEWEMEGQTIDDFHLSLFS